MSEQQNVEKDERWQTWETLSDDERSFAIGWMVAGLSDHDFAEAIAATHRHHTSRREQSRLPSGPWPAWGDESRFPPEERS